MNSVVFGLTLEQVLGRRRTLLIGLFALLPIGLSILVRVAGGDVDTTEWAAEFLFPVLVIGAVLPLAALVFGTAVFGTELDDGTAVYLLTKPLTRRAIILPKLLVAWLTSGATLLVTGLVGGLICVGLGGDLQLVFGFTVASAIGALVYSAVFLMLSIMTGRALIIGLAYVFLWEGVITGLFTGTRNLSIREYTLSLGDALSGTPAALYDAHLATAGAIVGIVVVTVVATWLAIRQLENWEIGEHA